MEFDDLFSDHELAAAARDDGSTNRCAVGGMDNRLKPPSRVVASRMEIRPFGLSGGQVRFFKVKSVVIGKPEKAVEDVRQLVPDPG